MPGRTPTLSLERFGSILAPVVWSEVIILSYWITFFYNDYKNQEASYHATGFKELILALSKNCELYIVISAISNLAVHLLLY